MKILTIKTIEEANDFFGNSKVGGVHEVPFYVVIQEEDSAKDIQDREQEGVLRHNHVSTHRQKAEEAAS